MAPSPRHKPPPPTTITSLPEEVKELIATFLGPCDLRQARLATRHLRYPFVKDIKRLYARNASLPPNIIQIFPFATEVVLSFDCCLTKDQLEISMQLFSAALPKYLQYLSVSFSSQTSPAYGVRDHHHASLDAFFLRTLPSLPCHKTLKTLHVSDISGKAAKHLLKSLPHLTDVELCGLSNNSDWAAIDFFPTSLERFKINTHDVLFDLANLALCSKLRYLELNQGFSVPPTISNLFKGLAGCTSLTHLHVECVKELDDYYDRDAGAAAAAALADIMRQLQQLQQFRGPPRIYTSSSLWRSISKSPLLTHVETQCLCVDSTDVPAHNVTHLKAAELKTNNLPADQPLSGVLTKLLPGLQELHSDRGFIPGSDRWYQQRDKSVSVLHQHQHVRVVVLGRESYATVWQPPAGIPRLQVYEVRDQITEACLDGRILELSACGELQELRLGTCLMARTPGYRGDLVTLGGLQKLVDGACKQSLRRVRLSANAGEVSSNCQGVAPVAAVALLRAGLPQLSELELDVQLQRVEGSTVYSSHEEPWKSHEELMKSTWPLDEDAQERMLALMQHTFVRVQKELCVSEEELAGMAHMTDESAQGDYAFFGFITVTATLSGCAVRLRAWEEYERV